MLDSGIFLIVPFIAAVVIVMGVVRGRSGGRRTYPPPSSDGPVPDYSYLGTGTFGGAQQAPSTHDDHDLHRHHAPPCADASFLADGSSTSVAIDPGCAMPSVSCDAGSSASVSVDCSSSN